jgi:hypothetical protein
VRGGFVSCNNANTATSAAKIHFNFFFIPSNQTRKQ